MARQKTEETPIEGLERFLEAQDAGYVFGKTVYEDALAEIKAGEKRTHWIWFVFPQLKGLGTSAMCERYGIRGLSEAVEYLKNETLRARLVEITNALLDHAGKKNIIEILGSIDAMKVKSCMTLFLFAAKSIYDQELIGITRTTLLRFYAGSEDKMTIDMLIEEDLAKQDIQKNGKLTQDELF